MKYTLSLCAAALLCSQPSLAEISDLGSFYSDIKLRYEQAEIDDPADNDKADAALADIAVGFKSADYAGFSVLAEYEAGVLALDAYAPLWQPHTALQIHLGTRDPWALEGDLATARSYAATAEHPQCPVCRMRGLTTECAWSWVPAHAGAPRGQ